MVKILIVDDESAIRKLVAEFLRGSFKTRQAKNVEEAQVEIEGNTPDLVISDVNMPNGSGFDLLAWMKKKYPEIPTLIMSGRDNNKAVAMENGAAAFIKKPFNVSEFLQIVTKFVP